MALWFPEKCLDGGSLKRLRVPTSLGVSQARALDWACGPLPSPPLSHSERSQSAGLPCSPADPQPHSFSRAFFRKHLSPHCPPCSPGPGMGSGLDARVSHREPLLHPVSQGCHPVALEPHLGCHGGIRHRHPFQNKRASGCRTLVRTNSEAICPPSLPTWALHLVFWEMDPPYYCSPLSYVLGDPRGKETCPAHKIVGADGPARTRPLHRSGMNLGWGCRK